MTISGYENNPNITNMQEWLANRTNPPEGIDMRDWWDWFDNDFVELEETVRELFWEAVHRAETHGIDLSKHEIATHIREVVNDGLDVDARE